MSYGYYYDNAYSYDAGGSGYTTTFGGNFLVDQLNSYYGNYISRDVDQGYQPGYGHVYYHGFATSGPGNTFYYSVTDYNTSGYLYSHKTGYLSEPGPTITESYSYSGYFDGSRNYHSNVSYSYDSNGSFFTLRYDSSYYSNGSTSYSRDTQSLFHNDLHGNDGTYTTYSSSYTDSQGHSYFSSGHS